MRHWSDGVPPSLQGSHSRLQDLLTSEGRGPFALLFKGCWLGLRQIGAPRARVHMPASWRVLPSRHLWGAVWALRQVEQHPWPPRTRCQWDLQVVAVKTVSRHRLRPRGTRAGGTVFALRPARPQPLLRQSAWCQENPLLPAQAAEVGKTQEGHQPGLSSPTSEPAKGPRLPPRGVSRSPAGPPATRRQLVGSSDKRLRSSPRSC